MSRTHLRLDAVIVVLVAMFAGPSAASAEISFDSRGSVFAGPSPSEAEVDDFDGDGRADIAVLARDYVWVLLGRGRGSLHTGAAVPVGGGFTSTFASSDFNSDGDPDLILGSSSSPPEVSVLLGAEGAGFREPVTSSVPAGASSIATGDFDRDGRDDAVVVHYNSDSASVLVGRGDGTFESPREVSAGSTSSFGSSASVEVGDMNRDSDPDLVVVTSMPSEVEVLTGAAGATFESREVTPLDISLYAQPAPMELGNADGDEYPDLVVAADDVAVLRGTSGGTFRRPRVMSYVANAAGAVTLGDFDRDGLHDLAIGNNNSPDVFLFVSRGRGRFRKVSELRVSGGAAALGVADFSGDQELDLAVADARGISVFINSRRTCGGRSATRLAGASGRVTGGPGADVIIGTSGRDVLEGRGGRDLICGRGGDDVLRGGPGSDRLAGEAGDDEIVGGPGRDRLGGGLGADRIVSGRDGDLVRSRGTRSDTVNCGAGIDRVIADRRDRLSGCERLVAPPVTFETPAYLRLGEEATGALVADDFNGDRDPDLGLAYAGNLAVRSGEAGLRFARSQSFSVGEMFATSAVSRDFNADGDPDIAVADAGGNLSVLFGTEGAGFGSPDTLARRGLAGGLPDRDRVVAGDFDRDGMSDLAMAAASADEVQLFRGRPGGGFGTPQSIPAGPMPVAIEAGDFDGDSNVDFAVGHGFSGDVSILRGPAFDVSARLVAGYQPHAIIAGDFDGDREPDLAIPTGWVSVFRGRAGAAFAGPVTYPPPAQALVPGDFDGDGDTDLAAAREDGVSILVGVRGAAFRRLGRVRLNGTPQAMAVADFDRDGDSDLALLVGSLGRGNVAILANARR